MSEHKKERKKQLQEQAIPGAPAVHWKLSSRVWGQSVATQFDENRFAGTVIAQTSKAFNNVFYS